MKVIIDGLEEMHLAEPVSLLTIANEFKDKYNFPIMAVIVDKDLRELTYKIDRDASLKFLDMSTDVGMKIYLRTLTFLFVKACKDIFPGCIVDVQHSLGDGLYCEIHRGEPLSENDVELIEARMKQLVQKDLPIVKTKMPLDEAILMFKKRGMEDKVRILKHRDKRTVNIYELDGMKDYFFGYMLPSTGFLKWFKLHFYLPGIILQFPKTINPTHIAQYREQPKLSNIFREAEQWARILNVHDVGSLNDNIKTGHAFEIIRVAEALHEKKIAEIADIIYEHKERTKIILIAGPSSSGKTTFAQRLIVQLKVNGLFPISISTDDYFFDRDKTPLCENGKPDFESLEAIDLKLFNRHLTSLIQQKEVILPKYNFHTGKREFSRIPTRLRRDQLLIIEGIHALNERLTASIPKENKFKIYISALTQLNIYNNNRISTTDTRLLRRIVRDSWARSSDAKKTISMWKDVQNGAEKNIFPYQEQADVMFNSALVYELSVLKKYAEPLLKSVTPDDTEYIYAKYLLKFLQYFVPIDDEREIPLTSIIREFIGGSCFNNN